MQQMFAYNLSEGEKKIKNKKHKQYKTIQKPFLIKEKVICVPWMPSS